MVEGLNGYFSSVFTREDISSLPVPDVKFQVAKWDYLGQLIVSQDSHRSPKVLNVLEFDLSVRVPLNVLAFHWMFLKICFMNI